MSRLTRTALLTSGILALGTLLPASAQAAGSADTAAQKVCVRGNATGVGQDLGNGSTVGTIYVGDQEVATSQATFTITGTNGPVASFTGPIVFTADPGTLTAQVEGRFNTSTGRFHAVSTSVTGTEELSGVFGKIRIRGLESLTDGSFTETLKGRLCTRV